MQYTVKAVNPTTRDYQTQFGDMKEYQVKFNEIEAVVKISQKATTAPPKEGDVLNGTIDMSAQYGPKFKKEYNPGGFGGSSAPQGSAQSSQTSTGSRQTNSDPFTMYLSYAKDLAVALIASKGGYDEEQYAKVLDDVIDGGYTLYEKRPGGEPAQAANKPQDETPGNEWDDGDQIDMSKVDEVFGTSSDDEVPFK